MFPEAIPFVFAARRGGFGPGGPWNWSPRDFGFGDWGGERTRRGDIKYLILEVLAEGPRHGYDIIKELEARRGGRWRPSPGSVYPTLQLLEDGGYVTSEPVGGKRVYTITDEGRALLASRGEERERPGVEAEGFRAFEELSGAVFDLGGAVMQAMRNPKPERVSQVRAVLEKARREIYALLAEE